jgi:hypothetical protein
MVSVPKAVVGVMGLAVPQLRELRETRYQFDRPYVLDSSRFETTFGMAPTPVERALKEILEAEPPNRR